MNEDVAEWFPDLDRCWYVTRTWMVRHEYSFTIDRAEADAIDRVLARCGSTEMVVMAPGTPSSIPAPLAPVPDADAMALCDDNGNGRITCAEARAHGTVPVRSGHPADRYMRDADGDGIVCRQGETVRSLKNTAGTSGTK